jgi:hypothetical protein
MVDVGREWAAAAGHRSPAEALRSAERENGEIGWRSAHVDSPGAQRHVLDRVARLTEAFDPPRPAAAWPQWPASQGLRQQPLFQRPANSASGVVNGVRPAPSDPSRSRREMQAFEPVRIVRSTPRQPASPLRAFVATFFIAMPVFFIAALFLPPATPYPEWGIKALAELTFTSAGGAGDAAASTQQPTRANRQHREPFGSRLAVASRIEVKVDEAVPLPISIKGVEALGEGSALVVRGLPDHASLSHGEALEPGAWRVDARWAAGLTLTLHRRIDRPQAISLELIAPDGELVIGAAATTLVVEPAGPGR